MADQARAVRLGLGPNGDDPVLDGLATRASRAVHTRPLDVTAALAWVRDGAAVVPHPGSGRTRRRWEWLATVASVDLTLARIAEPHLDALSILAEADMAGDPAATWGVWAAESPAVRLEAGAGGVPDWQLDGTKPWCSLAGQVDHALVTAWRDDGRRGLYAVDLADHGVRVDASGWQPAGLAQVVTATVTMGGVPARAVGEPGWYIDRPGFAWGGVGVAAIWYGGAVALARRLAASAAQREPDQVALVHLGAVEAALTTARAVLAETAEEVDARTAGPGSARARTGPSAAHLAARARQVVADAAEEVLARVGRALGPGPLAHEPEHARRVADLGLYLRQHHAERDQAALGRLALDGPAW